MSTIAIIMTNITACTTVPNDDGTDVLTAPSNLDNIRDMKMSEFTNKNSINININNLYCIPLPASDNIENKLSSG